MVWVVVCWVVGEGVGRRLDAAGEVSCRSVIVLVLLVVGIDVMSVTWIGKGRSDKGREVMNWGRHL